MYPNIPVAGQDNWRSVPQGLQSDSCKTASLALYCWTIAGKITQELCMDSSQIRFDMFQTKLKNSTCFITYVLHVDP